MGANAAEGYTARARRTAVSGFGGVPSNSIDNAGPRSCRSSLEANSNRHEPRFGRPNTGGLAVSSGDLDADGDLDIVASAFLPFGITDPQTGVNLLDGKRVASLVWLEQTSPRQFETHVLETGRYSHATVKCADVDGDGDLDLLTGHFTLEGITPRAIGLSPLPGMITIWENQLR